MIRISILLALAASFLLSAEKTIDYRSTDGADPAVQTIYYRLTDHG